MTSVNNPVSIIENYNHFIVFLDQVEDSIRLRHMIGLLEIPSEKEMIDIVQEFLEVVEIEYDNIKNTRTMLLDKFAMKTLYEHFLYGNKITLQ